MLYANLLDTPAFAVLALVLFFGLIVGAVILVKKYAKPFQGEEEKKTDEEIAAEELNRVLVDLEEETREEVKAERDGAPTEEEALDDTMARTLGEIDDPEALKAMEEYAKAHPEEAKEFDEVE